MANTKSALKRIRQNDKRRLRNRFYRSRARTFVKKVRQHVAAGKVEAAEEALQQASSALDKAAEKGILHPNSAARRKSRLAHLVHQARASSA